MEQKIKILTDIFQPTAQDCRSWRDDLQLAITLNPDLMKIEQAMEEYSVQKQSIKWVSAIDRLPDDGIYNAKYRNDEPCTMEVINGVVYRLCFTNGSTITNPHEGVLKITLWLSEKIN